MEKKTLSLIVGGIIGATFGGLIVIGGNEIIMSNKDYLFNSSNSRTIEKQEAYSEYLKSRKCLQLEILIYKYGTKEPEFYRNEECSAVKLWNSM